MPVPLALSPWQPLPETASLGASTNVLSRSSLQDLHSTLTVLLDAATGTAAAGTASPCRRAGLAAIDDWGGAVRTVKRHGRVLLATATLDLPLGISVALTAGRRARNAHARLRRGAHNPGAHQDGHPADVHRVDVQDALGRRHKLEIDQLRRGPQLQGGWGVGARGAGVGQAPAVHGSRLLQARTLQPQGGKMGGGGALRHCGRPSV